MKWQLESRINDWLSCVGSGITLPTHVLLWNGSLYRLGGEGDPEVLLRINGPMALPYLLSPSLDSLGEAYVKGAIDIEGELGKAIELAYALAGSVDNAQQSVASSFPFIHTAKSDRLAIRYHYDVSNEFYAQWLDPDMVYSCAYFEDGNENLSAAQKKKIDHILTKIDLRPGHTLLDIGCGWGALVIRAAERFGAHCVGVTLSANQFELASERVRQAGLEGLVEIRLQDYREIDGTFDRITSVGMFEHVGLPHLASYFGRIRELLADDGLAMNHGITSTDSQDSTVPLGGGEFIGKFVFPGGELPHLGTALCAMQDGGLEPIDVENLRRHYERTLTAWSNNFERRRDAIRLLVGEEKFRIWRVYLAGCAHAFRRDVISVFQVLCHKSGQQADTLKWSRSYMYQPRCKQSDAFMRNVPTIH